MLASLRIRSGNFDVDSFCKSHPRLTPTTTWRSGETLPRGRKCTDSGLSLEVGSEPDWASLLDVTLRRLEAIRAVLDEARASGAEAEVDFGVDVGGQASFSRSVAFSQEALRRFLDLGVSVVVSAYPASDDGP
jgi:hypothetical protein